MSGFPRITRRLIPAAASCLALVLGSGAAMAEDQSWLANSATFGLGDGPWSLGIAQETRSYGLDYGDVYLQNVTVSMARKLPRNFSFSIGYRREEAEKSNFDLRENRLLLEGGWVHRLAPRWRFDVRMRNEIRTFESDREDDDVRIRFRFRLRTERKIGQLKVEPFVWTEIFETLGEPGAFERNRFGLGAAAKVRPNVSIDLHYLRQDTEGKETIHGFGTGVDLKF
jgi:Protein of unknown function (DUF2490)